ncbi:hypothetical protein FRC04_005000 [Tulasnella sp. 424]|nr:hypothetical protein FRC04_005000 [Tulasnella sp. 424]KAG8962540.1 hypothetical protein FRC05_005303 [Tulasnella sp. 425]
MTAAKGGTPPVRPLNLVESSSNSSVTTTKPRSARSTPRASISLLSPGLAGPQEHQPSSDDVVVLEEAHKTLDYEADDAAELKEALRKVLLVADKMSETLASLQATQQSLESQNRALRDREAELETSLLLANSNLTLERANNEMLEEALKREGSAGAAKDIGWKRWSEREGLKRAASTTGSGEIKRPSTPQQEAEDGPRRRSSSSGGEDSASASTSPTIPAAVPAGSTVPAESSRFFKFRFGSGVRDSVSARVSPTLPNKSAIMAPVGSIGGSPAHLTSASLPSLHATTNLSESPAPSRPSTPPPTKEDLAVLRRELESLKTQLSALQADHSMLKSSHASLDASHKTLTKDKQSLEEEIESLSQALFEEANKMVADERKKRAAYEEELEVCRAEKAALKGALKVVEAENGVLRQTSSAEPVPVAPSSPIEVTPDDFGAGDEAQNEDDAGSVSSLQAVKSPTDPTFVIVPAQPHAENLVPGAAPNPPNRPKKAATPPVSYTPVYI